MSRIAIHEALAELEAENGRLTPERVVEAARADDSPLHSHFEWDDSKAAAKHRLDQARTLITSVRVLFRVDRKIVRSVAYVRDPECARKEQGYRTIESIRSSEDDVRNVLLSEFGMAGAHLARARQIAMTLSLERDVDQVLDRLGILRAEVEGDSPPLN